MAITDYNSLAETVKLYLNRSDPTTVSLIPQFITIAEQNIYRDLRTPKQEARVEYLIGDGVKRIEVPQNYLQTINISMIDNNIIIRPVAYTYFTPVHDDIAGFPTIYTRHKDSFLFDRIPEVPTTIELLYYRSFEKLDPGNATGNLDPRPFLEVTSDAWLYAALVAAATFNEDSRISTWLQLYSGSIATLTQNSKDLELSGAPLVCSVSEESQDSGYNSTYNYYV